MEFDKYFSAETKSVLADWEAGNFEGYSPTALEKYNELNAAKAGKDEKAVAAIDDKIKELAKNETAILREAKDLLVRWEGRDPEVYLLWTTMTGRVLLHTTFMGIISLSSLFIYFRGSCFLCMEL